MSLKPQATEETLHLEEGVRHVSGGLGGDEGEPSRQELTLRQREGKVRGDGANKGQIRGRGGRGSVLVFSLNEGSEFAVFGL